MNADVRVLMFGWEFPPFNSGGLGVACFGLTKALVHEGVQIAFVLPRKLNIACDFMDILYVSDEKDLSLLEEQLQITYTTNAMYNNKHFLIENNSPFASLVEEVRRYGILAKLIAKRERFDVIHAHDWLTFQAGLTAQRVKDKPLVTHMHATEFDRTGNSNVNQYVYDVEKHGMQHADGVIAVSNFTKNIITGHYGIPSEKIDVIHNGIDSTQPLEEELLALKKNNKIVLFVGRLTLQKGPDYFLKAAKRVLEYEPNVYFVIVGSGDMKEQLIRQIAQLNISDRVIFTGFLRDEHLRKIYQSADLFVMPSVSEPFGITGLESSMNGTPVLVSKQAGVSEVLTHALKADFWDVDEMTNKILAVLTHHSLKKTLRENAYKEAQGASWEKAAKKVKRVYKKVIDKKK